jgi:hypothetical protein
MIKFFNILNKVLISCSVFLTTTIFSSFVYGEVDQALLVEKHAEFILKNKSKIESHFELIIAMLDSEKYKSYILNFDGHSIQDFIIYKALVSKGHDPFDLVLDAHKALSLPGGTNVNGTELYKYYVTPYDPSYIGAFTTGYQLQPNVLEKATEAVEFLMPLYGIFLDALLETEEFNDPYRFRYSNHNYGHGDGLSEKFRILGSSDARINKKTSYGAFFPTFVMEYGLYDSLNSPRNSSYSDLNLSQLRLLEKIWDFKSSYPTFYSPAPYTAGVMKFLISIQEIIEKRISEPSDFSDLGSGDVGSEESSDLNFDDLEL